VERYVEEGGPPEGAPPSDILIGADYADFVVMVTLVAFREVGDGFCLFPSSYCCRNCWRWFTAALCELGDLLE
jgi:hypothetical protein